MKKRITTERTETTEKNTSAFLCELCDLCGEVFLGLRLCRAVLLCAGGGGGREAWWRLRVRSLNLITAEEAARRGAHFRHGGE